MQDRAKAEYAGEYRDQDYTVQVLPSAAPAPAMSRGRVVLRIGLARSHGHHGDHRTPLIRGRYAPDGATTHPRGLAQLDWMASRAAILREWPRSQRPAGVPCAKDPVTDRGWGALEADELEAVPRVWRESQLEIGAMSPLRSEGTHTTGIQS
jgi:hypothetical protein